MGVTSKEYVCGARSLFVKETPSGVQLKIRDDRSMGISLNATQARELAAALKRHADAIEKES